MAKFDLVINNANVLTHNPEKKWQHQQQKLSIGCKDGKVVEISTTPLTSAQETIEAEHLHLLPGCIDSQVHFREPGLTHKEDLAAGTLGALRGGVTAVFEMPNTNPNTTTKEAFEHKLSLAKDRCWVNYAFFIGASHDNIKHIPDLEKLPGCVGIKIFMGSSTGTLLVDDDKDLENILRHGKRRIAVHCEDETRLKQRKELALQSQKVHDHPVWRDEDTAFIATEKITRLAQKTGRPLHVLHITSQKEIEYLENLKYKYPKDLVSVECLPQHLTLHAPECYDNLGSRAQMNPPIRSRQHQEALWRGIANGTVDVIGSDHAPHTLDEKALPYPQSPSGMPGTQTLIPLMLTHVNNDKLSLERLCQLISYNPCRLYGVQNKGQIAKGFDADFTLIDMKKSKTIENSWIECLSGWSPFEGFQSAGWPVATILAGQVAMRDDEVIGAPKGQSVHFKS